MATFSRRQWIRLFAGGGLGGAAYARYIEPGWVDLAHHRITLPAAQLTKPIRLAHLSDLHASAEVPVSFLADAFQSTRAAKPDLICVTGDFVTNRHGFDARQYSKALRILSDTAPTFAVLGNHDGGGWSVGRNGFVGSSVVRRILNDAGITLLHNLSQTVTVRGQALQLVGLGDLWNSEVDAPLAFAGMAESTDLPTVLLAHNPDTKDSLDGSYPWHLMLSGHTHGGQVYLPFFGAPIVPVQDTRYVAGLGTWSDRQIFVTRGVGTLHQIRFNCRPEIAMLELTGPAGAVSA